MDMELDMVSIWRDVFSERVSPDLEHWRWTHKTEHMDNYNSWTFYISRPLYILYTMVPTLPNIYAQIINRQEDFFDTLFLPACTVCGRKWSTRNTKKMQTQTMFSQSEPCCSMCKKDKNLQDWCLTTAVTSMILSAASSRKARIPITCLDLALNCSTVQMRHLLLVELSNNTLAFYCIFSSYCNFDFWHLLLSNCSKNGSHRCGEGEIKFY